MLTSTPAPPAAVRAAPPAGGGLAHRLSPPFRLPGAHFAVGLAFWLAGATGLVWVAPEITAGSFLSPRVVAVTHLFTLGWITLTIQGALYQFLPVALSEPIRSQRMAYLSLALFAPGLSVFTIGLLVSQSAAVIAGASLFAAGLLGFAGNLACTLRRAWRREHNPFWAEQRLTWWALTCATVFLVATVLLGMTLSGNLRWGYLGGDRLLAVALHLHVAVAGWVMLVMVGVAHRLLPMFLLSHGAPEWPGHVAGILLASGTGALLVLHHRLTPGLLVGIAGLLVVGVCALVLQAVLFFRHRKRPALDSGLRMAGVGLIFLVVSLVFGVAALVLGWAAPHVAAAYAVVLVLGGISLFVAGHYYKILPFLVWYHRFGPLVGTRPLPRVTDLYAARPADVATVLLATGVLGLATSTLLSAAWAARAAAVAFALGAAIVAAQMWITSRRRPE